MKKGGLKISIVGKGILVLLPILFFFVKIVKINGKYIICSPLNSKGEADFINSVTSAPVKIFFKIKNGFTDFKMITDEKTENYYTSGLYSINGKLKKEEKRDLSFCSIKGINVKICGKIFIVKNNCLFMEVIWPPESF